MPLQQTSGAASYDAFGGGVPFVPNYIEDVFNVWVYPGSNSATSITNGIDLSGKGGLVWTKGRTGSADNHLLIDTVRGVNKPLRSNETGGQYTETTLTAFNANGYSITGGNGDINLLNRNYVSWTFRKALKFFDVVTYTGTGVAGRQISHALGSSPGCIIVKRTDTTSDWAVYHRGLTAPAAERWIKLNTTAAETGADSPWSDTAPTSTNFTVNASAPVNASGGTYVAYLFAHNAGGFGLSGTDNVISCGSFTTDSSGIIPTVNLGYEPQWILAKPSSGTGNWFIMDNMRGWYNQQADQGNALFPNTSGAEAVGYNAMIPTATGFTGPNVNLGAGVTYIYIAIRRGPMAVPTTGTSVYNAIVRNGTNAVANVTGVGFPPDLVTVKNRNAGYDNNWVDKLRGALPILASSNTAAEVTDTPTAVTAFGQDGVTLGDNDAGTYGGSVNYFTANSYVNWFFRRAPGFFDEVCYTGNSTSGLVVNHNLAVVPELVIFKKRDASGGGWPVWTTSVGTSTSFNYLNSTAAVANQGVQVFTASPTSTTMTLGSWTGVNNTGTMVAYLFASCPGVSKCLAFTGTGALQTINCGFTSGARFVLIKRTDSTGDWYVWDSSRGLSSSNDPYLLLNSTAAEVTSTNWVDTTSTGFQVTAASGNNVNINGASYIALAIS